MARALPGLPTARESHPFEDTLALVTLIVGLAAFVLSLIHSAHFVASCLGVGGFIVGMYSQLVSATTAERWVNVLGIGLAFLGAGIGLAQGGFSL